MRNRLRELVVGREVEVVEEGLEEREEGKKRERDREGKRDRVVEGREGREGRAGREGEDWSLLLRRKYIGISTIYIHEIIFYNLFS